MAVSAIEHRGAAENQLNCGPGVLASRNRVHIQSNQPALLYGVDLTTAALKGTAYKAADVLRIVTLFLWHAEVLSLSLLRSCHSAELINKLRPEQFFCLPAC